jgi:RNA polymerase sigma-70 factor (ECF subfamily)
MSDQEILARRFEQQRPRLIGLARRMLGSAAEAEDVVQDAWMRLSAVDSDQVEDVDAWLTTVVSRLSVDVLRSARHRHERPWEVSTWDPDDEGTDTPEAHVARADQVGAALLAVLDLLTPPERIALLLHDVFALSFDDVATMTGRAAAAVRQHAARGRRPGREDAPGIPRDPRRERTVVSAWLAAVRDGDPVALLRLLDEGAVLEARYVGRTTVLRGAEEIAASALGFRNLAEESVPVRIDGDPGVVGISHGRGVSLMALRIVRGRILAFDVLADPGRIGRLDLGQFGSRR